MLNIWGDGATWIAGVEWIPFVSSFNSIFSHRQFMLWAYPPISVNLFCKHSQVTFMPYRVVLKDERPTSNIERPTSNEKQTSNIEHSTPFSVSSSFPIQHSMLDVRCSMFIFFSKPSTIPRRKNNLALMRSGRQAKLPKILPLPRCCNQGLSSTDLLYQRQSRRTYIGT